MEKQISVTIVVTDHLTETGEQDGELNARAVIEQAIYLIQDNKLATPDEVFEALEWWTEEIYEVYSKVEEQ